MQALNNVIEQKLICSHCGDVCKDDSLTLDNNRFCCLGCKTVFEILHENGLEEYYELDDLPGISLKNGRSKEYFDFLEVDSVRRKLLSFESPELASITLYIPSIHCSSCIWLLENLFKLHSGVSKSEVNFPRKEVFLHFNPSKIGLRELIELLSALGYEPQLNLDRDTKGTKTFNSQNRKLIIKIGVAGFCFGNIMLLSFPEYLGLEQLLEKEFSEFFSYVNILFSLPVLLYSASGYFVAAYKGLNHRMISIDVPIVLGILALFSRSIYEVVSQTGPGYFDSLSGLVFFLLIGKWFQSKTYESLLFDRNYKSYFPVAVTRLKDAISESIRIEDLREGDVIMVRNGELIPADAYLLSTRALIDNSFVTGESVPIEKRQDDYIFAGGRQSGSAIKLRVCKEVSQSYLTQLWNSETFNKTAGIGRKIMIDKISKYFTWVVLGIAFIGSMYWLVFDPSKVINVFTAVLIVACPCALALSTPFAIGAAMRILGRNGCYLKNGDIIEELEKIDHIVFDKTGTITFPDTEGVKFKGHLKAEEASMVSAISVNSFHPLSLMITDYLMTSGADYQEMKLTEFEELPGQGLRAKVNGRQILLGTSEFVGAQSIIEDAVASTSVFLKIDDQLNGYFELKNHYREGLDSIIKKVLPRKLSMLSGDNNSQKTFLGSVFPQNSEIRFEQSAYDKLDYINELQSKNWKVLMVGDGLNDAGALAQSNVGMAVTENINNFTPASDIILSGKEFQKLPEILNLSKSTIHVIIVSFVISFLYNILGISFALSGNLTPVFAAILMPLSSISVVLFTTIAVNWKARKLNLKL